MRVVLVAVLTAAVALGGAGAARPSDGEPARALRTEIVGRIPHDVEAFTEGLVFAGSRLYESTGLYGASGLRELDPQTGRVLRRRALPARFFAEGLAAVGGRLVQLTWRERVATVWDAGSLRQTGGFRYAGEGWGLCYDGRDLVQSDGSSRLTFRDPVTFAVRRRVAVTLVGQAGARLGLRPGPVSRLNELECRGGSVFANVWQTDAILVIDPGDGNVTAVIDGSGLPRPRGDAEDVLNGIAFDPAHRAFLLTGKRWPWLYRVRLVPR